MSSSASEAPKALALSTCSSYALDVIEVAAPALTLADIPPSPKLSSVPSNAPSAVPTPCVSKPVSSLAKDASNAAEFNDLSSDDVVDGPEPSLLPS
ncbi:hypothetical protein NL676_004556 [Syzygium grande]|nr:hypothetical protein NL676_004556 [Syzygium grande]